MPRGWWRHAKSALHTTATMTCDIALYTTATLCLCSVRYIYLYIHAMYFCGVRAPWVVVSCAIRAVRSVAAERKGIRSMLSHAEVAVIIIRVLGTVDDRDCSFVMGL